VTIDSVPATKPAVFNSSTQTVRLPSTPNSGSISLTIPPSPINYETRVRGNGVLLPEQGVASASELMLKNEAGAEIDAQFDILSHWPDGSIKSVLVHAAISADTTNEKIYTLDYGAGVLQSSYSSNLGYTENASTLTVSTGNARFVISKTTGMMIEGYADTAGDQTYATQLITDCELFQQDSKDNASYSSDNETAATVTVTKNGVMLIEVYAVGRTRDVSNNDYTEYRIWYRFYKDSDHADISYTMIDDAPQHDIGNYLHVSLPDRSPLIDFECRNLGMNFTHNVTSNRQFIFGGESSNSNGAVTGEHYLFQTGNIYANQNAVFSQDVNATVDDATGRTETYSGVQSGNRAKGFSTIHNGTTGVTLVMADFWKEWPHELSLDTTNTKAHFFPDRYHGGTFIRQHADNGGFLEEPNTLYSIFHGMAKTYRLRVILHRSTPDETKIENSVDDFNNYRLQLRPSAQSLCDSKALYDLSASDAVSILKDQNVLDFILLRSQTNRPHRVLPYGWRYHGNVYRGGWHTTYPMKVAGFYNGNHFMGTQHFTQYARTLVEDWYDQGVRAARYFQDILVSHAPSTSSAGIYPALEPLPKGIVRILNHDNPFIGGFGRPDHNHAHCGGLLEYFLMTGDPRSEQVLTQMGDFYKHIFEWMFPNPRPATYVSGWSRAVGTRAYIGAERDLAWAIHIMNQYIKMTNDAAAHQNEGTRAMSFLLDWWKQGGPHYIRDVQVSTCDYTQGTSTWLLDQSDNTTSTLKTNGNSPWMCSALLMACLHWYDNELRYNNSGLDLQEFREMLYQVCQFINVWGYNETAQEYEYTMDPARSIPDKNGAQLLISPMAKIYLLCKADKDASNLANPEWYDTATWKTRILFYGLRWETTQFSTGQSGGFYGYELSHDQSFWTNLATIRAE